MPLTLLGFEATATLLRGTSGAPPCDQGNLSLTSSAGCWKCSPANALAEEIGFTHLYSFSFKMAESETVEFVFAGAVAGQPVSASQGVPFSNKRLALRADKTDIEDARLQQLFEKGAKAWADVPDAAAWVEELRGY